MRHQCDYSLLDIFRLFKPLHYTVWLICVLCVMCASISLWFIDLTSPVLQIQRKLYSKVRWISKTSAKWMQDEVLYNVGSVLSQGKLVRWCKNCPRKADIQTERKLLFVMLSTDSVKERYCQDRIYTILPQIAQRCVPPPTPASKLPPHPPEF